MRGHPPVSAATAPVVGTSAALPRLSTGGAVQYFDVVMTGCRKPGFFSERNLLFAVNPADSRLSNTDNGAPLLPIDQADVPSSMPATTSPQMEGVVRPPSIRLSGPCFICAQAQHMYGSLTRRAALSWHKWLLKHTAQVTQLDLGPPAVERFPSR